MRVAHAHGAACADIGAWREVAAARPRGHRVVPGEPGPCRDEAGPTMGIDMDDLAGHDGEAAAHRRQAAIGMRVGVGHGIAFCRKGVAAVA